MYHVEDEPMETIHLYVMREEEKRTYTAFPLFCAFLCVVGMVAVTLYSAQHPSYEHARLTVPAQLLPLKVFKAEARIIPTGVKAYPATYASGRLTLTNGSILSETLPSGVVFSAGNGVEVQTTAPVFIPAGSASGYGIAIVAARAVQAGKQGNVPTLAINAVYGTALYVRNLSPFTGGTNTYSVTIQLPKDRDTATAKARALVVSQKAQVLAYLAKPCIENLITASSKMIVSWACQFATYTVPSYMHVAAAHLFGRQFLVDVVFVPRPERIWIR